MKREVGSGETGKVYTPKNLSNQIGYHLFGINSGLVLQFEGSGISHYQIHKVTTLIHKNDLIIFLEDYPRKQITPA